MILRLAVLIAICACIFSASAVAGELALLHGELSFVEFAGIL